jgi:hypothetical protein
MDPVRAARAASRLSDALQRRATLDEGVGVLQAWTGGTAGTARRELVQDFGFDGQDIEAARMIAIVNATADPNADPDWDQPQSQ